MNLEGVLPSDIDTIRQALPWIEGFAAGSGGRYTAERLIREILGMDRQLWVLRDGGAILAAMVTEVHIDHQGRRWCRIVAAGGEDRGEMEVAMREFLAVTRDAGFAGVDGLVRPGWARVLKRAGFAETHRLVEIEFP